MAVYAVCICAKFAVSAITVHLLAGIVCMHITRTQRAHTHTWLHLTESFTNGTNTNCCLLKRNLCFLTFYYKFERVCVCVCECPSMHGMHAGSAQQLTYTALNWMKRVHMYRQRRRIKIAREKNRCPNNRVNNTTATHILHVCERKFANTAIMNRPNLVSCIVHTCHARPACAANGKKLEQIFVTRLIKCMAARWKVTIWCKPRIRASSHRRNADNGAMMATNH